MMKKELKRDAVISVLKENVAEVTFTKKDGTERVMKCTLQTEFLPIQEPKQEGTVAKKVNDSVVAVFDIEAEGFRSFRLDSVTKFVTEGNETFA
jgi:hypothetical protein